MVRCRYRVVTCLYCCNIELPLSNDNSIIGKWLSSQRFSSPNLIGRELPVRPPSANQVARRAAGVAPRGNPTISPCTGTTSSHPRFSNPSVHLQLRQRGDENGDPLGRNRPAWCGTPARRSLIGWDSKITLAPPGDDKVPSPDQKSLHTSTTPTTRGRKR